MLIRVLNKAEESIISFLLIAMTMMVFVEVVMRFGFGEGLMWGQELTLHISAWFVLFGASYGLKVGAHIGVDAFVKILPPALRRIASLIAVSGALLYCGLFLYGSWIYLAKMKMIGIELEDLQVPAWVAHSILLIGIGFLAFRLLQLFWAILKGEADGFRHIDEAEESMHLAEELSSGLKQEQSSDSDGDAKQ